MKIIIFMKSIQTNDDNNELTSSPFQWCSHYYPCQAPDSKTWGWSSQNKSISQSHTSLRWLSIQNSSISSHAQDVNDKTRCNIRYSNALAPWKPTLPWWSSQFPKQFHLSSCQTSDKIYLSEDTCLSAETLQYTYLLNDPCLSENTYLKGDAYFHKNLVHINQNRLQKAPWGRSWTIVEFLWTGLCSKSHHCLPTWPPWCD